METKHFYLGTVDNSSLVKIFRIIFGVVCIAVAIFWLDFNINSIKTDGTLWITIIFLLGFGFYQIWSGLGRANRFIEIASDYINLRKNPLLPSVKISAAEIDNIELFPLSLVFFLKSEKRILLRFGTSFPETNEIIKDEILTFAERNNIHLEIIEEKI
jgi:hypothetical protein